MGRTAVLGNSCLASPSPNAAELVHGALPHDAARFRSCQGRNSSRWLTAVPYTEALTHFAIPFSNVFFVGALVCLTFLTQKIVKDTTVEHTSTQIATTALPAPDRVVKN